MALSASVISLGLATASLAADAPLKQLTGHVPAAVRELNPKGSPPATNRMNLAIGVTPRDPVGLSNFLANLYDPFKPQYHHYLTPEQFAEQFGPSNADYAVLISFARSHNLTVTATHANRLVLDVSGTVQDVEKALHIKILTYRHPTEPRDFYAPSSDPSVDASLPVADVSGLSDFLLPHPMSLHTNVPVEAKNSPRSGSGAGGTYIGSDFRAAYLPGVTLEGAGQMLGLLEFDGFYASDISTYESDAGYFPVPLQTILLDGYNGTPTRGSHSGNPEVSLDIELAVAMAPGLSKIVVFEAGPSGLQNDVLSAMAESNQIKQFSCSWGWGGGPSSTTDTIFQEMSAQGQSFFSASGDSDAFTVGAASVNGVDNTSLANAPASCPYITVVGGTTLTTSGSKGSWVSETAWNWGLDNGSYVGTSGGVSSYYSLPVWQTNISMSSNGGSTVYRNIPDVALTADNIFITYGNGKTETVGGTSCATPLWAALASLMNQQAASAGRPTIGFINPAIYSIGKGSGYGTCFHDITSGNNVWNESPNSYYAVAGYDLCTGWGTPIGQALINAVAGAPDSLSITPGSGFTAVGPNGGPFEPFSQIFVLTNESSSNLTWTALSPATWLAVSPAGGTLAAHAATSVVVSLTQTADNFAAGVYSTNVIFSNTVTRVAQNESFGLQVGQSIVENGGFETGDFTGWTLVGGTVVNGRFGSSTVYDAVEGSASGYNVVHSGSYGAFLGDDQLATLSQTVPTLAGNYYVLSFWLDNPTSGSGQQFLAQWNGSTIYGISNPPAFGWTNLVFIVSAPSSNSVVEFAAENDPNYFGLDDVSVTPIPPVAFQTSTSSSTGFNLSWNTGSGLTYQVQYKTNLMQATWINLGSPVAGTGGQLLISDTNAISASSERFYRLVVSP
jgi:subtilase family serine protease